MWGVYGELESVEVPVNTLIDKNVTHWQCAVSKNLMEIFMINVLKIITFVVVC